MRSRSIAAVLAATCPGLVGQDAEPLRFRYRAGDVYVVVERTLQRETDDKLGFAIAVGHTTERRYTVLAVSERGDAEVLVEETAGPQQLHEYVVRGRDERQEHLAKGFDADATAKQRVLVATFSPTAFRCEPARDEPAVFYLQELPELLGHALRLPPDGATAWRVEPALPRLAATLDLRRSGDEVRGAVALAIRDDRVRGGAEVACTPGAVVWQFDPAMGLPRSWRSELRYPRFPIGRPNVQTISGELVRRTPLGADDLAQLRADLAAFVAVRDAFFAGRFPAALQAAEGFAAARPQSRLLPSVQQQVAEFRRQVPRFGQVPPEPAVAHWFGGEAATLRSLRGNVVLLDFWAVWCVPCVAGMEHLIGLQRTLGGEGLRVLGLTRLDERQSLDAVRTFRETGYAAQHGGLAIDYPLVVLQGDATHDWFAIRAIPKLVLLDREGAVYWEQTGGGGQARLERIVASLLVARR